MKQHILLFILLVHSSSVLGGSDIASAVSNAVIGSHYSAIITHTDVAEQRDNGDYYHIYDGDVLETIRGEQKEKIRYVMSVEEGEELYLDSAPMLITLCSHKGELYWPGTGSAFPATKALLDIAKLSAKGAENKAGNLSLCE